MKIALFGCNHGVLPKIEPCDLVIITGDCEPVFDHSVSFQLAWHKEEFAPYLNRLPAKNVLHLSGNHSFLQYSLTQMREIYPENGKVKYLRDEMVEIDGVKIFGTPWIGPMKNWAFGMSEQNYGQLLADKAIGCDILVAHQPAFGVADTCMDGDIAGSKALRNFCIRHGTKYLVHSHIHEGYSPVHYPMGLTKVFNCSYLDHNYEPAHNVIYFNYEQ